MINNGNGLCIEKTEFLKLPQKQQMCVLFENQQETIRLIKCYKSTQKLHNWMVGLCLAGVGLLFKIVFVL